MKNKRVIALGVLLSMGVSLTGCSGSEIAQLNTMKSLNSEAENNSYSMTLNEKQSMIYASVAERTLLDLSVLDECSEEEITSVKQYMDTVDGQLAGSVSAENGVIDECFTDYLLAEFEKSPYYWQRTKTAVRGIDSESRSIVVDVTYNTIGFEKDVIKDSFIVKGEPNFVEKEKVRFSKWDKILALKTSGRAGWQQALDEFTKVYGDPQDIFESQRNLSLTEQVYETGNQRTYSGVTDNELDQQGGTMTVRYVLVPKYVLGVNLGLDCKHMYVTEYRVSNDATKDLETFKEDGYATIADNISKVINSYFKCIDEEDMNGLYKLTDNFKSLDKYYEDMFDTTYTKHNGFEISLFDIEGTHIKAGISISSKVRAKGSNMTMPSYRDRYYVEMELVDEQLKVTNLTLLSRDLEGEPAIDTESADAEGFVASIDLSNDDKSSIEKLICDFSALQLQGDKASDKFMDIIDYSMSDKKLDAMREDIASIGGKKKVVWLQNYQQGTSNYASVKCRELFQQEDNSIIEATTTYEFISKGDKWYIFDYNILSSVKLDTTNLSTSHSLCHVSPGKVDGYTSQIVSTKGEKKDGKTDVAEGVVFEHPVVIPVLKNGTQEQGLVQLNANNFTETQLAETLKELMGDDLTVDMINAFDSALGISGNESMMGVAKRLASIKYNYDNNRYADGDYDEAKDKFKEDFKKIDEVWKKGLTENKDNKEIREAQKQFSNFEKAILG